jgi:hypothetical protein
VVLDGILSRCPLFWLNDIFPGIAWFSPPATRVVLLLVMDEQSVTVKVGLDFSCINYFWTRVKRAQLYSCSYVPVEKVVVATSTGLSIQFYFIELQYFRPTMSLLEVGPTGTRTRLMRAGNETR